MNIQEQNLSNNLKTLKNTEFNFLTMKIGVSPVRISFAGGGTDMPEYFNMFGGNIIGTTINLFTYVVVHSRFDNSFQAFSPDFQKHYRPTKFSKIEIEDGTEIISSVVKFLKYKQGIDVVLFSDVPAGSGLGASSSLAVNLVNTLSKMKKEKWKSQKIAETAFQIERRILKWPMGKQDEYLTAFGGLRFIEFERNNVKTKQISLSKNSLEELQKNLILFFVGNTRKSSVILNDQLDRIKNRDEKTLRSLHYVKDLTQIMYDYLKKSDITKFGELLDKGWQAKKNFSPSVSNDRIDKIYQIAKRNGSIGGKLTGAGGGGHLLLYCERLKQKNVIKKLENLGLRHIPFNFYSDGPKVLNLYENTKQFV